MPQLTATEKVAIVQEFFAWKDEACPSVQFVDALQIWEGFLLAEEQTAVVAEALELTAGLPDGPRDRLRELLGRLA